MTHQLLNHGHQRIGRAHDERVGTTIRGDVEHAGGAAGERRLDFREPALERAAHERSQRFSLRTLQLENAQRGCGLCRSLDALDDLLHSRKNAGGSAHNQRLRDRLGGDDGAGAFWSKLARNGELANGLGDSFEVSIGQTPSANFRIRHRLGAIELFDKLLEAGHARERRVDDERVGLRIGAHHNFTRRLKLGPSSSARIHRHRRLRIHLVDGLGQLACTRNFQRENADLSIGSGLPRRTVEILDDLLNLGQQIGMRGHDQRVGLRLSGDLHGLRALFLWRALRICLHERGRESGSIGAAQLQNAQRWRGAHGHIEILEKNSEQLMLARIGGNEQRVGAIEHLDHRLTRKSRALTESAGGEAIEIGLGVDGLSETHWNNADIRARTRRGDELATSVGKTRERLVLTTGNDGSVGSVDLRLDRGLLALGGFERGKLERLGQKHSRIARSDIDHAHATLDRHCLQLLEQLLGLLEGHRIARDNQRAAGGLSLHQHIDRLRAVDAGLRKHSTRAEIAQRLRDALDVTLVHAIGAQFRLWRQRRAIEREHELLKARAALRRRLDDERVGGCIGGDEDFLRLLQMGQRTAACIERNCRRRIELVERGSEVGRLGGLERHDESLAGRARAGIARAVEFADESLDFLEHTRVRGDDQRVGGGIALDAHGLQTALVGSAFVVTLGEHRRDLICIAATQLQQPKRRQFLGRGDVEIAHEAVDERELRRFTDDVKRVGRLDDLDLGRRNAARRIDGRRRREQRRKFRCNIACLGCTHRHDFRRARRRHQLARLSERLLEHRNRSAASAHEQRTA